MIFTNILAVVMRCFLDISKAFDKVWQNGIIFKLEQNDISGKLQTFTWLLSEQKIKDSFD